MQNLREQLLKAGLITTEQRERAEADMDRGRNRRRAPDRPTEDRRSKPALAAPQSENRDRPKLSKKELMRQPLNRMLDTSDPKMLGILQAIEQHRLRDETKGEVPFHFTLRDGRVRKIFVTSNVSAGLEAGRLAIVESGDESRHVIVASDAVTAIRQLDPEAIRFVNPS